MSTIRAAAVLVVVFAVGISNAGAVMELTYTPSGVDTIVTAADGATTYWEMVVETTGTKPGRVKSFIDKSGASSDTYNYAHSYGFGMGLFDPMDNGTLRDNAKYTISNLVTDPSAMTFTLTEVKTRDDGTGTLGTGTYQMDWTIGLPTVTAAGYDTSISVVDTFTFDANWVGSNADARIRARMRMDASPANDEYTFVTHNGTTEGPPDNLSVEATASGTEAAMAAGSTFTLTLTYGALFDDAYDSAVGSYAVQSTDYAQGSTDLGITGTWAANPGPAGSERVYSAQVDVDISIIASTGKPGDADGDGDVDLDDFVILKTEFGTTPPPALQADFDGDGDVDLDDFVILKTNFGLGAGS